MRGFVASVDVMMALFIAIFVSLSILYLLSTRSTYPEERLYRYSTDILTVASKDGSFALGLSGNWTKLDGLLDSVGGNICFNLSVKDDGDVLLHNHLRSCGAPQTLVVGKRAVTNNSDTFLSELSMWYR